MVDEFIQSGHLCECGSRKSKESCCMQYFAAGNFAPTAEILMRSRYTAYCLKNEKYLLETWHESRRPTVLDLQSSNDIEWLGLEILRIQGGQAGEPRGLVEFIARYQQAGQLAEIHEASRFIFENGRWYYVDGDLITNHKPGRNDPCSCGSGKKYKRCCG